MEELLLQILGAGGDDDAFARTDERHEVGEGLAGTGTGFNDEMAFFFDRLLHGLGHL